MEQRVATFVKDLEGFTGHAALFRLNPLLSDRWNSLLDDEEDVAKKVPTYEYVVVSATTAMFSGPETYIFGADENGQVINWIELDGSMKGTLSHHAALNRAGYTVIGEPERLIEDEVEDDS
jgi:hypothetical protein